MEPSPSLFCVLLGTFLVSISHSSVLADTQIFRGLRRTSSDVWYNNTCEDLCGCIEAIMWGMESTQICMEVKGYPCHLVKQLARMAPQKKCSGAVGLTGDSWFECSKGTMQCIGGDIASDNEINCTGYGISGLNGANKKNAYLGCEATTGENSSVTCVVSRDDEAVGHCFNNAECIYKKVLDTSKINERVMCPSNWVLFKQHCFSPINGIDELNILDQRTWNGAAEHCERRWNSTLLSVSYLSGNVIRVLQSKGIFTKNQEVWIGMYRDKTNSSFGWRDGTPMNGNQAHWPWAPGHPSSLKDHNYVYVLNGSLYTAKTTDINRYSCKMKVTKNLSCRQPQEPGEMEGTTAKDDASTVHEEFTTSEDQRERFAAFNREITQARNQVSNYLMTFTNDTTVLDTLDTLVTYSGSSMITSKNAKQQSVAIVETLDSVVDGLAESINGPAMPLVVSTPDIVLKVLTLCTDCEGGEEIGGQIGNQTFSVSLPDSVKTAGATLAMSSASLLHKELPATTEAEDNNTESVIGSLVSSISLHRWDSQSVALTEDEPLQITFSNLEKFPNFEPSCRYWKVIDESTGGLWSSKGCDLQHSNETHTTCHITHLTSFAVIMQIKRQENLPKSLDYLTWAGCALSISCLATLMIIFFVQRMYKSDRNFLHMNLAGSLMLAQIIFVFGIDRTQNKVVCKFVGISVHFFLLATFFWMLNEGIFLLSKTTSAKTRWLRMPTYCTIGWVFPLIIVGVTMAVSVDFYDSTERCWLTVEDGGILAFVGPAAVVITVNLFILIKVIRVFLSLKANMNKKKAERTRIALRAILLTLPLLGCTWLFGIFSFNSQTLVFAFLFVILNSLQGVFIFILYCLLNDEIKKGVRKRWALLQNLSSRSSNTRTTRTGSGSKDIKGHRMSKTPPADHEATKV